MEREVFPTEKWFDFELFFSCSGRPTGEDGPDQFTGCYPAATMCLYWAARACLDLYFSQKEERFLALARRSVTRLSMFQQVFDHPANPSTRSAGSAVMTTDGEFNDARQPGAFRAALHGDVRGDARAGDVRARDRRAARIIHNDAGRGEPGGGAGQLRAFSRVPIEGRSLRITAIQDATR